MMMSAKCPPANRGLGVGLSSQPAGPDWRSLHLVNRQGPHLLARTLGTTECPIDANNTNYLNMLA
jgi:hypothetical protein